MIFNPTNILPQNVTCTAKEDIEITWKNNGDLMTSYQIVFFNNSTGTQVHDTGIIQSYTAKYILPANTLTDGNEYTFTVTVFNSIGESATSSKVLLRLFSRPQAMLLTDGIIRNQTATVMIQYSQSQYIQLKAYRFILYDEYKNVLEQSDYKYDGLLTHTFNYTLVDDTTYYIEGIVVTQNDLLGTTGLVSVVADYVPPTVYFNLGAETLPDKPYVRLTWTSVRIIGHATNHKFTDDGMIDVRNGIVYFDEGFKIDSDFTLKLWATEIETGEDIATLIGENSEIAISLYDNKIHAYKRSTTGFAQHIATPIVGEMASNSNLFIVLQQKGRNINIQCEVV